MRLVNPGGINFVELDLPDKVNSVLFPEISDEDTKVGSENISRFNTRKIILEIISYPGI